METATGLWHDFLNKVNLIFSGQKRLFGTLTGTSFNKEYLSRILSSRDPTQNSISEVSRKKEKLV